MTAIELAPATIGDVVQRLGRHYRGRVRMASPKGVHIDLWNGWTVSIQVGPGNYCDNRHRKLEDEYVRDPYRYSPDFWFASATAELAAWPTWSSALGGHYYRRTGGFDTVLGWQNPHEVLAFIDEVSKLR